jgi:hypothetical protein
MPADAVFLDTNGWLALLNASDSLSTLCRRRLGCPPRPGQPRGLTDWIVAETGKWSGEKRRKEQLCRRRADRPSPGFPTRTTAAARSMTIAPSPSTIAG